MADMSVWNGGPVISSSRSVGSSWMSGKLWDYTSLPQDLWDPLASLSLLNQDQHSRH